MSMQTWLFEPRDPLFVRDGRPFGQIPGARAASLDFPYPSTTTGAVRTASKLDAKGIFVATDAESTQLKELQVLGPLMVEVDGDGRIVQWLPPAPMDAVLSRPSPGPGQSSAAREELTLGWQRPLRPFAGAVTDLDGTAGLVGLPRRLSGKPTRGPAWWQYEHFKRWLLDPTMMDGWELEPHDLGTEGPTRDLRTHVALDPEVGTAADRQLFQTRSLDFARRQDSAGLRLRRFAIAVATDARLRPRLMTVGGERRLTRLQDAQEAGGEPWSPPSIPADLLARVKAERACRIILITPAIFHAGWRPGGLLQVKDGCSPSLVGAAVDRARVVSGWDFTKPRGGAPKPARRMAPAGSVYYLRLGGTDADVEAWARRTWMSCISDEPQDRLDGFGLAVLGTWNGEEEAQR